MPGRQGANCTFWSRAQCERVFVIFFYVHFSVRSSFSWVRSSFRCFGECHITTDPICMIEIRDVPCFLRIISLFRFRDVRKPELKKENGCRCGTEKSLFQLLEAVFTSFNLINQTTQNNYKAQDMCFS